MLTSSQATRAVVLAETGALDTIGPYKPNANKQQDYDIRGPWGQPRMNAFVKEGRKVQAKD